MKDEQVLYLVMRLKREVSVNLGFSTIDIPIKECAGIVLVFDDYGEAWRYSEEGKYKITTIGVKEVPND